MLEQLEKFENFCKANNIDLDGIFKTLQESQRVDNIDVNEKYNTKIIIIKNTLREYLKSEGQIISEELLEFVIRLSNLL